MRKVSALILTMGLVAAACGDETPLATESTVASTVATTEGTTETTVATDTTETTETTDTTATTAPATTEPAAPEPGTLAALSAAPVEDPLMGSGWHDLAWVDDAQTVLQSPRSVTDSGELLDLLTLTAWDPAPATAGLAADQILVNAWVDYPSMDIIPWAAVLYTPGADGFEATVVIDPDSIEAALLETTDYAAAAPGEPIVMGFTLSAFDLSTSRIIGIVMVNAFGSADTAYEGEIECDFSGSPLVCITLTDDGVLRPGDEGEAVEELQNDLKTLGYFTGNADGKYGPATGAAVTEFQRDYWLGRDGKVGPKTSEVLKDLIAGTSNLLLISKDGTSKVAFGVASEDAYATLVGALGVPDSTTGWYQDGCDGHDWFKASWDGFTIVLTDRDGARQFDGWEVNDLADLPSIIRIAGGIKPSTTWSYLDNNGADFFNDYLGERWRIPAWGYTDGRFTAPVTDPPAGNSAIASFGTGTGGFESC
jgi:peptidoglycan hydrolase-like protein with peptidoglycan-binding domain